MVEHPCFGGPRGVHLQVKIVQAARSSETLASQPRRPWTEPFSSWKPQVNSSPWYLPDSGRPLAFIQVTHVIFCASVIFSDAAESHTKNENISLLMVNLWKRGAMPPLPHT